MKNYPIAILMGSDSDLPVVEKAFTILKNFGVNFDANVLSAHRTPDEVKEYVQFSEKNGTKIFIAAAGKAAHLAGVVAAYTTQPVIGVPIESSFIGLDALLSTVQMPPGIPVATVAVNGADNAALLALEMLAISDDTIKQKLIEYRKSMKETILQKNQKLKQSLQ